MEKEFSGIKIELRQGDIADQPDCEAVVNAANPQLESGGGVAGAIHRKAGPGLAEEARKQAPISPGEAVITGGHDLPNDYVIHCLGPVYGRDKPEGELLGKCYYNALKLADDQNLTSIAFPAISTGIYGYPVAKAAKVSLGTILKTVPQLQNIEKIVLVLHSSNDLEIHERVLNEISAEFG